MRAANPINSISCNPCCGQTLNMPTVKDTAVKRAPTSKLTYKRVSGWTFLYN